MKKCQKCLVEKKLSHFNHSKCYPDGRQPHCRVCGFQMRLDAAAQLPTAWETRQLGRTSAPRKGVHRRTPSARSTEAIAAKNYVAAARVTTKCGQCNQLGVEFYHPAPDRTGKLMVAGFVSMGEIDSRIDDMIPLCMICKPLIEKGKLKTHLFD